MRNPFSKLALVAVVYTSICGAAMAQSTAIQFGSLDFDSSQPVEITSDSFRVSQKDRTAVFTGNVLVVQGELRMSAGNVLVDYVSEDKSEIERLRADGGVTLVSGSQAAEAESAVYAIADGNITMEGSVLLTQGENALSGQVLTINLATGFAEIEGRVKTVFKAGSSN